MQIKFHYNNFWFDWLRIFRHVSQPLLIKQAFGKWETDFLQEFSTLNLNTLCEVQSVIVPAISWFYSWVHGFCLQLLSSLLEQQACVLIGQCDKQASVWSETPDWSIFLGDPGSTPSHCWQTMPTSRRTVTTLVFSNRDIMTCSNLLDRWRNSHVRVIQHFWSVVCVQNDEMTAPQPVAQLHILSEKKPPDWPILSQA